MAPDKGDSAREQLQVAAARLFAERGYEGVSVRQIAGQAGLHFALVRYYFGDKLSLYKSCLESYCRQRLTCADPLLTAPRSHQDFADRLLSALRGLLSNQIRHPDLTRIFLAEVERQEPLADDILGETVIVMARRFVRFFTMARANGLIDPDSDPQFLTHLIQGAINHFVRTDSVRKRHFGTTVADERFRESLIADLHRLIVRGTAGTNAKCETANAEE